MAEYRCKYCNTKITGGTLCRNCREKLKLIRTIKAMLLGCTIEDVIRMEARKRR